MEGDRRCLLFPIPLWGVFLGAIGEGGATLDFIDGLLNPLDESEHPADESLLPQTECRFYFFNFSPELDSKRRRFGNRKNLGRIYTPMSRNEKADDARQGS